MLNTPIPELIIGLYSVAAFLITLYTLGQFNLLYYFLTPNKPDRYHPKRPDYTWEELPTVTVQLPMYNEFYVAKQVIDA